MDGPQGLGDRWRPGRRSSPPRGPRAPPATPGRAHPHGLRLPHPKARGPCARNRLDPDGEGRAKRDLRLGVKTLRERDLQPRSPDRPQERVHELEVRKGHGPPLLRVPEPHVRPLRRLGRPRRDLPLRGVVCPPRRSGSSPRRSRRRRRPCRARARNPDLRMVPRRRELLREVPLRDPTVDVVPGQDLVEPPPPVGKELEPHPVDPLAFPQGLEPAPLASNHSVQPSSRCPFR